ncbi:hypothetical protein V6N13_137428 [Hibiscus sabdariffa]
MSCSLYSGWKSWVAIIGLLKKIPTKENGELSLLWHATLEKAISGDQIQEVESFQHTRKINKIHPAV